MFRGVGRVLIGMFVLAAVVSGCGGGDDDDSLTKAEFKQQANAICKQREDEKNKALRTAINNPPKDQQASGESLELELLEDVALPPIVEMNEELRDLGLPEGEEEKAEAMLDAFEEEVEKIEANPKGVLSGDVGEFPEANKLAIDLGLKACAAI